jgi:hypothetical protein
MLLIAAAAIASAPPPAPQRPVAPIVQARAMVTILSGARLHFGEHWTDGRGHDDALRRDSVIHGAAGDQPAKLFEFQ